MPRSLFNPADWDLTPEQAIAHQKVLARSVRVEPLSSPVTTIAGVDCGFEDSGRIARAAVVVMSWPGLAVLEERIARDPTRLPYIPGLLSFRELPVVLQAFDALEHWPDLLLCDGQGIAHPRRLGIAAHLGVITDLPAIGVGKSRLVGSFDSPGEARGSAEPLLHRNQRIGTVLRSRTGVKPLFVSPGHRVSHDDAVEWVLATGGGYRLPEPVRAADRLASRRGGGGRGA
jgi:deoxyribonuclease V